MSVIVGWLARIAQTHYVSRIQTLRNLTLRYVRAPQIYPVALRAHDYLWLRHFHVLLCYFSCITLYYIACFFYVFRFNQHLFFLICH